MIRRLKLKFVAVTMSIVTLMLLVIFGMVLYITSENLEQQGSQMLETVAQIRIQLETGSRHKEKPSQPEKKPEEKPAEKPTEEPPKAKPREQEVEVRLPYFILALDDQGSLVDIIGRHSLLYEEGAIENIIALVWTEQDQTGILRDYNLQYQKMPSPTGETIVFVDISSHVDTLKNLITTCTVICFISFLLFLGLSYLLAEWMVKPVEQAWNQQRQFVADASHELKTPLTVIMTNAELLTSNRYTEAQKQTFGENIQTMSRQMRHLVEDMLELARVEAGGLHSQKKPVELSVLVQEAVLPFEPVCFEKGLTLEISVEEGIRVQGEETYLKQLVEILMDNAVKYSSAAGTVTVSLRKKGGQCCLQVDNPGEPIAREELKHLFARFYRADKARSTDGSYGLGLAIAEKIVQDHGGKIWAESKDGINSFRVQLNLI